MALLVTPINLPLVLRCPKGPDRLIVAAQNRGILVSGNIMPYNIKQLDQEELNEITVDGGALLRKRRKEDHEETLKKLNGYVKDFDMDAFHDAFTYVRSCLRVYQGGINGILVEYVDGDGPNPTSSNYYFAMESILKQINDLRRMIDGYDEHVTLRQAKANGIEPHLTMWDKESGDDITSEQGENGQGGNIMIEYKIKVSAVECEDAKSKVITAIELMKEAAAKRFEEQHSTMAEDIVISLDRMAFKAQKTITDIWESYCATEVELRTLKKKLSENGKLEGGS